MQAGDLRGVVARNIRELAEQRGMALNALADFAGVSRSQLFNVLSGMSSPSLDWVARIAKALDVEPYQLLAPEGWEFRRPRRRNKN